MRNRKIKRLFYNLRNPETHEKYKAYLDLLKELKCVLRSNNFLLPVGVEGYKLKANQDSEGNLVIDAFYRRQNFFTLHLKYGLVVSAELPLLRVHRKIWVEWYLVSPIMEAIEVLQKYDGVSETPISWNFSGSYKQLKSKYLYSDGVTRYEKI